MNSLYLIAAHGAHHLHRADYDEPQPHHWLPVIFFTVLFGVGMLVCFALYDICQQRRGSALRWFGAVASLLGAGLCLVCFGYWATQWLTATG